MTASAAGTQPCLHEGAKYTYCTTSKAQMSQHNDTYTHPGYHVCCENVQCCASMHANSQPRLGRCYHVQAKPLQGANSAAYCSPAAFQGCKQAHAQLLCNMLRAPHLTDLPVARLGSSIDRLLTVRLHATSHLHR